MPTLDDILGPEEVPGSGRKKVTLDEILGPVAEVDGKKSYSWGQVPIAAASNLLPSLGKAATDLYKGVTDNPVEFAKSVVGFPLGAIERSQTAGPAPIAEKYFDPAVKHAGRTLGFAPNHAAGGIDFDPEELKTNLAEDPAGVGLAVAPFLPGGRINPLTPAAKGAGIGIKTLGKVTDKARDLPIVGGAAKKATEILHPRLEAIRNLPTTEAFNTRVKGIYDAARAEGVNYTPTWYARLGAGAEQFLKSKGYDPALHPDAAKFLTLIKGRLPQTKANPMGPITGQGPTVTRAAGDLSLEGLETLRSEIGSKARDLRKADNNTDAAKLELLQDYLDDFTDAPVRPGDVIGGKDPQTALNLLEAARGVYKQKVKSQKLDTADYYAELDAAAKYTQAGKEHAYRSQYKKLLGKNEIRRWSPEERAALEEVTKGGTYSRGIGKFAPVGTVGKIALPIAVSAAGGAGFLAGGPVGGLAGSAAALGIAGIGGLGRKVAEKRTLGAVDNVRGVVAGGKLPGIQHPAQTPIGTGLAVGTNARNEDRKQSLARAEAVMSKPVLDHMKQTPHLRQPLNNWLSARASGRGELDARLAMAQALAQELKRPDLVEQIVNELGGQ